MAVDTKIFPVFEVEDVQKYTINIEPKSIAVKEYLQVQGRFKHLTNEQIEKIQRDTDRNWEILLKKVEMGKLFSEN